MHSDPHILQLIQSTVERLGAKPCFHYKEAALWRSLSWEEMWRAVAEIAHGLKEVGFVRGDRLAILSNTRMEWTLIDLAVLSLGGIVVPIYSTLSQEQIAHILSDADARWLVLEREELRSRLPAEGPALRCFIIEGPAEGGTLTFAELREKGSGARPDFLQHELQRISSDDVATYIYTSGTTGNLKGVVIKHSNIVGEIQSVRQFFPFTEDMIGLLCLPLPHVFARMVQFFHLAQGCQTAFAESLAKLAENYREIRPHFVTGVPRMLEKMHERIQEALIALPRWKRWLLRWVPRTFILRAVRNRFGGRLTIFISGGAPLSKEIARFFHGLGILVLEGYGLTETFAAVVVNRPDDFHFGTVGKPVPGARIKLAADGEILIKGPMVFREYLHLPEETRAAFDEEGWFQSGDIGEYSKDGFLRITDRKKNLIVTAGGKKIAPQPLEQRLEESPYIEMAFLYGDRRKYIVALITPSAAAAALAQDQLQRAIADHIAKVNQHLAQYETIKRFAILPHPFSIEGGELTPTLKLRRKAIAEKYREQLDSLYK